MVVGHHMRRHLAPAVHFARIRLRERASSRRSGAEEKVREGCFSDRGLKLLLARPNAAASALERRGARGRRGSSSPTTRRGRFTPYRRDGYKSGCDAVSCRLNISVSASFVWRCLSGSAMAPFSHPAHRTGRADLPHPALGQELTPSPTARRAQAGTGVRARSARKGARVDRSRPCVAWFCA